MCQSIAVFLRWSSRLGTEVYVREASVGKLAKGSPLVGACPAWDPPMVKSAREREQLKKMVRDKKLELVIRKFMIRKSLSGPP